MRVTTLFLTTNLAVLAMLSVVLQLFNIDNMGDMAALLIFALIFGMGGSFISLAMSKSLAKKMTGAQVIEQPSNQAESWLVNTVQEQAQAAGIGMPEIAIYDSPAMNAFATGMNRDDALVAVSTGLLHGMTQAEVEAVLAHEVSHIVNGDMVTLALIQGVLNSFIIVLAWVIGLIVDRMIFKNKSGMGIGYFFGSKIAEIVLVLLASIIVMWFSRQREFRADAGSARLAGADKMIQALQRLKKGSTGQLPDEIAAFGINGSKGKSLIQHLFSSHPPLEKRIEALQQNPY